MGKLCSPEITSNIGIRWPSAKIKIKLGNQNKVWWCNSSKYATRSSSWLAMPLLFISSKYTQHIIHLPSHTLRFYSFPLKLDKYLIMQAKQRTWIKTSQYHNFFASTKNERLYGLPYIFNVKGRIIIIVVIEINNSHRYKRSYIGEFLLAS